MKPDHTWKLSEGGAEQDIRRAAAEDNEIPWPLPLWCEELRSSQASTLDGLASREEVKYFFRMRRHPDAADRVRQNLLLVWRKTNEAEFATPSNPNMVYEMRTGQGEPVLPGLDGGKRR